MAKNKHSKGTLNRLSMKKITMKVYRKCLVLPWLTTRSQSGCARFFGSFVFNRKRNVVELEIKQDLSAKGALKYVVSESIYNINNFFW